MSLEFEKKKAAVADFKNKVVEIYNLLSQINKLDEKLWEHLYTELITDPVEHWRELGSGTDQSQFFHTLITSTADWDYSPNLDLPGGLIAKHVDEVILPTLKNELAKLQK